MTQPVIRTSPPLTQEELQLCDRVGDRLQAELAALVNALPGQTRTVREMANFLDVDRNLCQRISAAAHSGQNARSSLQRAPGARGMSLFIDAFERQCATPGLANAAREAVGALDGLIRELGGSQAQFNTRLQLSEHAIDDRISDEYAVRMRRNRHEADVQLLGIGVERMIILDLFRPLPSDPTQFEHAFIQGYVGVRTLHRGLPFVNLMLVDLQVDSKVVTSTLAGQPLGNDPRGVLLEPFCSKPLPNISARGSSQRSLLVLDADLKAGAPPIDVFTGRLVSPAGGHPALDPDPVINRLITPRYPALTMTAEIYMHRSMADRCQPSSGLYFKTQSSRSRDERWYDKLPNPPGLQTLGQGLDHSPASNPRQAELVEHVFKQLGWQSDEFVAHRSEVDYPLCAAEYVYMFDFKPVEQAAPRGLGTVQNPTG